MHVLLVEAGAVGHLSVLSASAARRLARRAPLAIRPERGVAIKRNVRSWRVAAPPDAVASALAAVLSDPGAVHGGARIRRPAGRTGAPFAPGERFLGSFSLRHAAQAASAPAPLRALLDVAERVGLLGWVEERATSDYAEIVHLDPRRVAYRYLEGCPMAGQTTYEVKAIPSDPDAAEVTNVFELQERGLLAVLLLHGFGMRAHDAVVDAQIAAVAALLGVGPPGQGTT